jgi:hypothetical protein
MKRIVPDDETASRHTIGSLNPCSFAHAIASG